MSSRLDLFNVVVSGATVSIEMPDQESHPLKPRKRKFSTPSISPKEESPSRSSSDVMALHAPWSNTRCAPQGQLGADCGDHSKQFIQFVHGQTSKAWPAQQLYGDSPYAELPIKHEPSETAQSRGPCLYTHILYKA